MLSQKYDDATVGQMLIAQADWRPFPTIDDRVAWQGLPETLCMAHLKRGETKLNFTWPVIPARVFLDFIREGNRKNHENTRSVRRTALLDLVIAECLEDRGRFLDDIANGIWCICEESYWGNIGALFMQKAGRGFPDLNDPVVELFTAETGAQLAWTWYLLGDRLDAVSPLLRQRIESEVKRRVLDLCLARDDFWWMGFGERRVNNWNPWINSNWLTCNLLMETDADRRLAAVVKSMRSVDVFVDTYPADGGCDEGPGYWGRAGASLFDCLELLRSATSGGVDVYGEPLIRNMAQFIYKTHIADHYFVNFADASALVKPSPFLVFCFGKRIGDEDMASFGAWLAEREDVLGSGLSMGRLLPALFHMSELSDAPPQQPLPDHAWLPDIEVMTARDKKGSTDGFFVAAKGGHNAESHNHNDVGQVVVYVDGKPVLIDAGVGTYTAQTFGDQRYELWTMQSAYHNLPTINGVMQKEGREFCSGGLDGKQKTICEISSDQVVFRVDLAGAYPKEAGLNAYRRSVRFVRGQSVEIAEDVDFSVSAGHVALNFLTPCAVDLSESGTIVLGERTIVSNRASGVARLMYDATRFTPHVETVVVDDARLQGVWGDCLFRIVLCAENLSQQASWQLRVTK